MVVGIPTLFLKYTRPVIFLILARIDFFFISCVVDKNNNTL